MKYNAIFVSDELVDDENFWANIRKMEAQDDAEADRQAHKSAKSPRVVKGRQQAWRTAAKAKRRYNW